MERVAKEFIRYEGLTNEEILRDLGHLVSESRPRPDRTSSATEAVTLPSRSAVGDLLDAGQDFWEQLKRAAARNVCEQKDELLKTIDKAELAAKIGLILTPILSVQFGLAGPALATIAGAAAVLLIRAGIETFCDLVED